MKFYSSEVRNEHIFKTGDCENVEFKSGPFDHDNWNGNYRHVLLPIASLNLDTMAA